MYRLLRAILFLFDPETAHHLTTRLFRWLMAVGPLRAWVRRRHRVVDERLSQTIWGIPFENPVGLAAGFDKNAELYPEMAALGFGFVEVGTVTANAQSGNPRPRLFRLKRDRAIINRMGFNNDGWEAAGRNLAARPADCTLGVNIGRSKVVANDGAIDDYCTSLEGLWSYASYVTINVSSPNTPDLRDLQGGSMLRPLLSRLRGRLDELAEQAEKDAPALLVKIAPDLSDDEVAEICQIVKDVGLDGIIATNTTISRDGLSTPSDQVDGIGAGGLSGLPLTVRSREFVRRLRALLGPNFPIVGVGGIASADDAWQMIRAGANLIQVYTGFIYAGPSLARTINRGLLERLEEEGFASLAEAAGADAT